MRWLSLPGGRSCCLLLAAAPPSRVVVSFRRRRTAGAAAAVAVGFSFLGSVVFCGDASRRCGLSLSLSLACRLLSPLFSSERRLNPPNLETGRVL